MTVPIAPPAPARPRLARAAFLIAAIVLGANVVVLALIGATNASGSAALALGLFWLLPVGVPSLAALLVALVLAGVGLRRVPVGSPDRVRAVAAMLVAAVPWIVVVYLVIASVTFTPHAESWHNPDL